MSRLDELIKELCPNGVTFQLLGNVCKIRSGWGFPNVEQGKVEGEFPFFKVGDMNNDGNEMFMYTANNYIDADVVKKLKCKPAPEGTIIFPKIGAAIGTNKKRILVKDSCYDNNVMGLIATPEINPRFLFYVMQSVNLMSFTDSAGAVPSIRKSTLEKYKIPVPPLEVQREIVRILDSFTLLTAELTAELTARKKQYEFYRDDLLKFDHSIPMVTLGDIATDIYRGSGIKRDEVTEDGIPCVRYGEIYTQYNTWFDECVSHTQLEYVSSPKYFEHGDILFAITGESVEDIAKSIAYLGHEKCLAGGDIVVLKHEQEPRYLAHILATYEARKQKSKGKIKSKVVHSSVPAIKEISIPLPPLDVQKRYADVLDNFEKICNDLNIGLPAEIEARQKQYEYYRDALLTYAATGKIILRQTDRQTDRQRSNN